MKTFKNLMYVIVATVLLASCNKEEKKAEGTAQSGEAGVDTATYKIDTAKSEVKWLGKKVTGQHNGKVKIQGGEITAAGNSVLGGNIVLNMASITSDDLTDKEMNGKLIGHLKSPDFFSTDSFPTANFVLKSVTDAGEGKKNITGDLTIKGITNEVTFPADVNVNENTLKGKGKATVDRTKWNIRYGSGKFFQGLGDKAIYDEVELEFDITANK